MNEASDQPEKKESLESENGDARLPDFAPFLRAKLSPKSRNHIHSTRLNSPTVAAPWKAQRS